MDLLKRISRKLAQLTLVNSVVFVVRTRALLWYLFASISFYLIQQFYFFTENLALDKPVKQSSTYSSYSAINAVNGIIYGEYEFSHTGGGDNEWWRIDLGKVQTVKVIELYVRTDQESKLITINKLAL